MTNFRMARPKRLQFMQDSHGDWYASTVLGCGTLVYCYDASKRHALAVGNMGNIVIKTDVDADAGKAACQQHFDYFWDEMTEVES